MTVAALRRGDPQVLAELLEFLLELLLSVLDALTGKIEKIAAGNACHWHRFLLSAVLLLQNFIGNYLAQLQLPWSYLLDH